MRPSNLSEILVEDTLMTNPQSRTFVLVHGAWHGGWVWRGVLDGLRARVRIPTEAGRVFRFEVGRRSDLKPATIPT